MAADKRLIIVVEGTSALGPHWNSILSDYLDKIIRSFCADDMTVQKSSDSAASGPTFELAVVVFNTQGPYSAYLVRQSGWTRDVENFLGWLSALSFSGGGFNDVATAEGLAEALMMFAIPQNGYQAEQNLGGKRHCILVSSSNPYPLPTPVYQPAIENTEQDENGEAQMNNLLYDAEAVSKWFGQGSISLSVICPKQLPKLRAIYNAAKCSDKTSEPVVDVKQPHFLVLISNSFTEACAALRQVDVPPSQNLVSTLPPASSLPVSLLPESGSTLNTLISTGNSQATIKVAPCTATSSESGAQIPASPHPAENSVPITHVSSNPVFRDIIITNDESVPVLKPIINNVPNAQEPVNVYMSTGSPQTVLFTRQCGIPSVSGSGTVTGATQPIQNTGTKSVSTAFTNSNLGIYQPLTDPQGFVNNTIWQENVGGGPSGTEIRMSRPGVSQHGQEMESVGMPRSVCNMQMSQQPKYIKFWEGELYGTKFLKPYVITKLEGYRRATAPETFAADWPKKMLVVHFLPHDFMESKKFVITFHLNLHTFGI